MLDVLGLFTFNKRSARRSSLNHRIYTCNRQPDQIKQPPEENSKNGQAVTGSQQEKGSQAKEAEKIVISKSFVRRIQTQTGYCVLPDQQAA